MRIASSMERMGDLAVHVAKSARLRYPARAVPDELVETFRTLGHLSEELTVQLSRLVTNPDVTLAQDSQAIASNIHISCR
jgi:phosphate transport system protein